MFFLLGVSNSSGGFCSNFYCKKGEESGKPAISTIGVTTGCFAGNSGPPEFSPVRTGLSLVPGQRLKRNPELHPFGNPRGFFVAEIFFGRWHPGFFPLELGAFFHGKGEDFKKILSFGGVWPREHIRSSGEFIIQFLSTSTALPMPLQIQPSQKIPKSLTTHESHGKKHPFKLICWGFIADSTDLLPSLTS